MHWLLMAALITTLTSIETSAVSWLHGNAGCRLDGRLVPAGAAVLRMSSNGRCCSIVWPEARRYAVYAQGGSDDWHKVDEESGTSVAWAGASSTYAVLHQPKVKTYPPTPSTFALLCLNTALLWVCLVCLQPKQPEHLSSTILCTLCKPAMCCRGQSICSFTNSDTASYCTG